MTKVNLLKKIDAVIGRVLTRILPAPSTTAVNEVKTILVVRPGGIGDAVLLIPVIQALKAHCPGARIDILAEQRNAAIFSLCVEIDNVFKYDKGDLLPTLFAKYDVVIDTEQWHRLSAVVTRVIKSNMKIGYGTNERRNLFTHAVDYSHERYELESFFDLVRPLGLVNETESQPEKFLKVPENEKAQVKALLEPLQSRPYVTLFPGASIPERRWGAEKFKVLAACLNKKDHPVVIIGGKEDLQAGDVIVSQADGLNLAGQTSLVGSGAVIENTALLVSGDSGMLHVGVGLNVPTVSLFGSGIAAKWAPKGERHIVINKHLDCSPCTRFGTTPPCPIGVKCLHDIAVDEVYAAVCDLLGLEQ